MHTSGTAGSAKRARVKSRVNKLLHVTNSQRSLLAAAAYQTLYHRHGVSRRELGALCTRRRAHRYSVRTTRITLFFLFCERAVRGIISDERHQNSMQNGPACGHALMNKRYTHVLRLSTT